MSGTTAVPTTWPTREDGRSLLCSLAEFADDLGSFERKYRDLLNLDEAPSVREEASQPSYEDVGVLAEAVAVIGLETERAVVILGELRRALTAASYEVDEGQGSEVDS